MIYFIKNYKSDESDNNNSNENRYQKDNNIVKKGYSTI